MAVSTSSVNIAELSIPVCTTNLVVELDNWYDRKYFAQYHGNEETFNEQQKSLNEKDKYLKTKRIIHIKIPLEPDIHFIDIERKLRKAMETLEV